MISFFLESWCNSLRYPREVYYCLIRSWSINFTAPWNLVFQQIVPYSIIGFSQYVWLKLVSIGPRLLPQYVDLYGLFLSGMRVCFQQGPSSLSILTRVAEYYRSALCQPLYEPYLLSIWKAITTLIVINSFVECLIVYITKLSTVYCPLSLLTSMN